VRTNAEAEPQAEAEAEALAEPEAVTEFLTVLLVWRNVGAKFPLCMFEVCQAQYHSSRSGPSNKLLPTLDKSQREPHPVQS